MATNPPKGSGRRGAVKARSQFFNDRIKRWVKTNDGNGQIMDVKSDDKPFKGVKKK